jgi:hypothetical protein
LNKLINFQSFDRIFSLFDSDSTLKWVNTNQIIYGGIVNIFKNMLPKNPSKNFFYEKVKMTTKGPFVVESFVNVGSFDCDCT